MPEYELPRGSHWKQHCSQISLLYNRTAITARKLDLANSKESRRRSKKNQHKNSAWRRIFSNNMRLEKELRNKGLRTRNSLMVYTEMQFKIKFSPIPDNMDFFLDIFSHLRALHSSVSTFILSSFLQKEKNPKILFFQNPFVNMQKQVYPAFQDLGSVRWSPVATFKHCEIRNWGRKQTSEEVQLIWHKGLSLYQQNEGLMFVFWYHIWVQERLRLNLWVQLHKENKDWSISP